MLPNRADRGSEVQTLARTCRRRPNGPELRAPKRVSLGAREYESVSIQLDVVGQMVGEKGDKLGWNLNGAATVGLRRLEHHLAAAKLHRLLEHMDLSV